jgi:hypothetical protein
VKPWRTITGREAVRAFLAEQGRRVVGSHQMTKRICHWPYCARCGLVALKNERTRRALAAPCVTTED